MVSELSEANKKISQRGNHGRHHWETHAEATRHS
jgi:hypothetical protein